MSFKQWFNIQETGTSTACVASFSRPVMPLVKRTWPTEISYQKIKKQPQVKEDKSNNV